MKQSHWVGLIGFCLWAGATLAQPFGEPEPTARDVEARYDQLQKRHAQRLHKIQSALKITQSQQAAWDAFYAAMLPAGPQPAPLDREELSKLSAPQRMLLWQQHVQAREKFMNENMIRLLQATQALYALLSPEQKKIFDDSTLPPEPRGHFRHKD